MTTSNPLPLFYRELVAFDANAHGKLRLPTKASSYRFAKETNVVPLLIHEVPWALGSYPLVFLPALEQAPPVLAVLVGIGDGHNRYIDAKGQWRADTYIPAWVRGYPFMGVQLEGKGESILALDPSAEQLHGKGDVLVNADGKPSQRLESIIAFQQEFARFAERTRTAVVALQTAGVLEEGSLHHTPPNSAEAQEIKGFLIVNEARLHALDGQTLATLNASEALGLAYAQLLSMGSLRKLMVTTAPKKK